MEDFKETEKKRELTEAEKKRLAKFETVSRKMEEEGYTKEELTVSIVAANLLALLLGAPFIAAGVIAYIAVNRMEGLADIFGIKGLVSIVVLILLVVIHEGIHGLTWSFFAENGFKDIEFGFIKQYLTPSWVISNPKGWSNGKS